MNRRLAALIGIVVIAIIAIVVVNLPDGSAPGPIGATDGPIAVGDDPDSRRSDVGAAALVGGGSRTRTEIAGDDLRDLHPSVRRALVGFTGRVIDAQGRPVEGSLVRLYRFAPDVLFRPQVSVFVDGPVNAPDIDAGDARTGEDGRFTIQGVFPRAMFLAHADADGDAPTWRIVERAAEPGELCDVGDIQLQPCGVLTGVVLDRDGEPLANALVRAVDLPGTILSFVPLERLDPTGGLIVSEQGGLVFVAPSWVERRFEQLPLAQTRTASDGSFRLTGVTAGGNLVAVTARGFLSHVRPREVVDPGEVKDLGRILMREGEYAFGKVVDQEGEAIAGAQVLIAGRNAAVPVHFASFAEPTNAAGEFELAGFPPGDVIVAARRAPGEPWIVSEALPVTQDIVITLPSAFSLTLEVVDAAGRPVADPRLQLSPGSPDDGSLEQLMWGVTSPIELESRRSRTEDGKIVLRELPRGAYTLLAASEVHATTALGVELEASTELRVELRPKTVFEIFAVDPDGAPVAGAAVFARAEGDRPRVPDAPVHVGTTDEAGRAEVDQVSARRVAVTAHHPAFGNADAEFDLPPSSPVVLRFETPGSLDGVVTDGGAPPPLGKWMVYMFPRGGNDAAFPDMPELTAPDAEGRFRFAGVRPGTYTVGVQSSLDVISSAGKVSEIAVNAFLQPELPSERVEVPPGGRAQVELDTLEAQRVDGPVGQIGGTVTIDGRLGTGYLIQGRSSGKRLVAEVNAAGRFDLQNVPVGDVRLQLIEKPSGDIFSMRQGFGAALWSQQVKVEDGKFVDLTIDVQLGRVQGFVVRPDGQPAEGALVSASGQRADSNDMVQLNQATDASGAFSFEKAPAGTYTLMAQMPEVGRAQLSDVEVVPGGANTGLRLQLIGTVSVRGRVDVTAFGPEPPRRLWMFLEQPDGGQTRSSWARVEESGEFEFSDVLPGTYRIRIQGGDGPWHHDGDLIVGRAGVEGFIVRPVRDDPKPTRPVEPAARSGGR